VSERTSALAAVWDAPGITPPVPRDSGRRRLGDVIVELGFADREAVEAAGAQAREEGRPMGQVLVDNGALDSTQLAQALAQRNGLCYVDLSVFEVDKGAANLVNASEARRYAAVPIAFLDERTLLVATSDPSNVLGSDDITMATGYEVRRAVSSPEELDGLISQLSRFEESVQEVVEEEPDDDGAQVIELRASAEEAPVVKLVHSVIGDAVERGASDIHFDPRGGDMRVRLRVDGVVIDSTTVPKRLVPGLVSRIKIMAELDIAERRIPQDGRVGMTVDGHHVDVRVATLPVVRGEAVVMRILDKGQVVSELDELGMEPGDLELVGRSLGRVHGAVLATGPTGAGKTTTLYAALSKVNSSDRTIITVEDPVEYEVDGIKQVPVNPKAGLTFATALRSILRSDPDVVMVGEIRDRETARIAIESALTGQLVLSTLHTNDAPMAAVRLTEMGIEPFLIASGIECVVAQRLARRLCPECKQRVTVTAAELKRNGFPATQKLDAYEPVGCVRCAGTGYRGRVGLYEVMVVSDEIRSLILRKASGEEVAAAAVAGGMRRLREDGLVKVRQGITSVPEVLRVLGT
jgi:type IV pilus assembly protein PilB